MFLFDKYRTSQQEYDTGDKIVGIRWVTHLRTSPDFCAESTAIVDDNESFYFGSHSGNFYCLNSKGLIEWTFTTRKRIYGSPIKIDSSIIFIGGDGILYSLKKEDGSKIWYRDLKKGYFDTNVKKIIQSIIHLPYTFSFSRRTNIDIKSWSSVNICQNKIIATGFGKGIYAYDKDGNEEWSHNLGFPRYQLCGVVIDDDDNIYCISRRNCMYKFNPNGRIIWKKRIQYFWHSWGNPSYNQRKKHIYTVFSIGESFGRIVALSKNGDIIWTCNLKSTIRGSVAISKDGNKLYCSDFSGYIYQINSDNGDIVIVKKISNAIRALWTTPTIDKSNFIYISTKDNFSEGRILKMNDCLDIIWEFKTNKTLSVPLILKNGDVCFGAWDGKYYRVKTK